MSDKLKLNEPMPDPTTPTNAIGGIYTKDMKTALAEAAKTVAELTANLNEATVLLSEANDRTEQAIAIIQKLKGEKSKHLGLLNEVRLIVPADSINEDLRHNIQAALYDAGWKP